MNTIETLNLSRAYGRTEAVRSLTLSVPQGGACALLGQNGAGKTTTLKMLVNLLRPTSGTATILGVDSRKLAPAQFEQIGHISENQKLPAGMTVRGFLDFCRALYPAWDMAFEARLLKLFELPPGRKLSKLSRGMQMKAKLLSSLAYHPKLIIMDEPFSGLDPVVRDDLMQGMLELADSGDWTMLISSHDIDDIERLVDRVAIIDSGKLLVEEPLESLQQRFRGVDATFAQTGAPVPAAPASGSRIGYETSGARARWIETAFGAQTEQNYKTSMPAASFAFQSMSLKEIYKALARNFNATKGEL
jgi:ABC-2 type transport system ATP-binding protein